MAKAKGSKEGKNAKSHIKARMDFLEKAANYLQAATAATPTKAAERDADRVFNEEREQPVSEDIPGTITKDAMELESSIQNRRTKQKPLTNISRVYISHMRGVSLKTQTRLAIPVKRSFCKRCETPLSFGVTCSQETQNASRGRRKPWADVMVVRCLVCGTEKRFPETGRKSKKLVERRQQKQSKAQGQDGIS